MTVKKPNFKAEAEAHSLEHDRHRARFTGTTVEQLRRQRAYGSFLRWHKQKQNERDRKLAGLPADPDDKPRQERATAPKKPTREDYLRSEIGQHMIKASRERLVTVVGHDRCPD